jgi:hypothetical protein
MGGFDPLQRSELLLLPPHRASCSTPRINLAVEDTQPITSFDEKGDAIATRDAYRLEPLGR